MQRHGLDPYAALWVCAIMLDVLIASTQSDLSASLLDTGNDDQIAALAGMVAQRMRTMRDRGRVPTLNAYQAIDEELVAQLAPPAPPHKA